jgi:hypothetical protein
MARSRSAIAATGKLLDICLYICLRPYNYMPCPGPSPRCANYGTNLSDTSVSASMPAAFSRTASLPTCRCYSRQSLSSSGNRESARTRSATDVASPGRRGDRMSASGKLVRSHLGCLTAKRSLGQGWRFLTFAAFRMRSSACDTIVQLCVRHVLCWSAFPLVSALGSTGSAAVGFVADRSAAGCSTLFVGITATMTESDFSCPCIIGYDSSSSRCGHRRRQQVTAKHETSQVPMRSLCT